MLSGGEFIRAKYIYKIFTIYYTYVLNIQKWETLHKYLNGFEVLFMQYKTEINGGILVQQLNVWTNYHTCKANV